MDGVSTCDPWEPTLQIMWCLCFECVISNVCQLFDDI